MCPIVLMRFASSWSFWHLTPKIGYLIYVVFKHISFFITFETAYMAVSYMAGYGHNQLLSLSTAWFFFFPDKES